MKRLCALLLLALPLACQVTVNSGVTLKSGTSVIPAAPAAPNNLFTQVGTTPVLLKGSTYDGWECDALAAPAETVRVTSGAFSGLFAATFSCWQISNGQWGSVFFTSPDMATWTYITGSLQTPACCTDYILGNSGLVVSGSTFIWAYTHYPVVSANHYVTIATSTDLINWTVVNASPTGSTCDGDPELAFNPSGTLELWTEDCSTGTNKANLYTSTDSGTTWAAQGIQYNFPANVNGENTGAPGVFYIGTTRYLTFDVGGSPQTGYRYTLMVDSPGQNAAWTTQAIANQPNTSLTWQSVQVFDGTPIVADTGDGRGSIPRLLYAGGDSSSAQDNTDSSIGLAYLIR